MTIELDRVDIINLLTSTYPSYKEMENVPKDLGHFVGGFAERWEWDIDNYNWKHPKFEKFSDQYLLDLYYKFKRTSRF